jgi:hypothetical protein
VPKKFNSECRVASVATDFAAKKDPSSFKFNQLAPTSEYCSPPYRDTRTLTHSMANPLAGSQVPRTTLVQFALWLYQLLPWAGLVATVVGARLWLIDRFGNSLPILDQWDAEGYFLLRPWFEGHLQLVDLFSPHNEHRIFFTRLVTIALAQINGQWDALPEMVVNALLCAALAAVLVAILCRLTAGAHRAFIFAVVTLWLALPYAQENTLWGFQSAFYFLLLFTILSIWGLALYPFGSLPWWVGAIGAICACLSLASGSIAAGVVLALVVVRSRGNLRILRQHIPTIAFACIVVVISLHFHEVPAHHRAFRAGSFLLWITSWGRCLAWPFNRPILCLVIYAPLLFLAVHHFRRRGTERGATQSDALNQFLLGIGGWVILQAASIAYARASQIMEIISSRYLDIMGLGIVANSVALIVLTNRWRENRKWPRAAKTAPYIWLAFVLGFACLASYRAVENQKGRDGQPGRRGFLRAAESAVRAYLETSDIVHLEGDPLPFPYVDVQAFKAMIDDPTVRKLLPAAARIPLHVEKSAPADNNFFQPGCPNFINNPPYESAWGSYSATGTAGGAWMESKPIRSTLPYLEFEVVGHIGNNMSLSLRTEHGVEQLHWLDSVASMRGFWRRAYFKVPVGSDVQVIARDDNAESWFAFRDPGELGRISLLAEKITARGRTIFLDSIFAWFVWAVASLSIKSWRQPAHLKNEVR